MLDEEDRHHCHFTYEMKPKKIQIICLDLYSPLMAEVGLESSYLTSGPVLHTIDESMIWESLREWGGTQNYREGLKNPLLIPK